MIFLHVAVLMVKSLHNFHLFLFSIFFSSGTAFTLLDNACQPPPFSLPSSGQALSLPLLLLPQSSSSSSSSRPVLSSSLFSASTDPALPLLVLLSAPHLHTPFACLRVSQGWRSRHRAWRFPRRTRWPEGRRQPEGCYHPSSVLSWLTSSSPNQSQTDQLTQYCCHPGGQL